MTLTQALDSARKQATTGIVRRSVYVVYNANNMSGDWRSRYETRPSEDVYDFTPVLNRADPDGKCYVLDTNERGQQTATLMTHWQ